MSVTTAAATLGDVIRVQAQTLRRPRRRYVFEGRETTFRRTGSP